MRKSFTLIELLIVITIIGILAVALVPKIAQGPARARDVQRKADLQNVATALELYYADHGEYPHKPSGFTAGDFNCVTTGAWFPTAISSYIDLPGTPSSLKTLSCTDDYFYQAKKYTSIGANVPAAYALIARMEITPGDTDGYFCLTSELTTLPIAAGKNLDTYITYIESKPCDGSQTYAYYTVYH